MTLIMTQCLRVFFLVSLIDCHLIGGNPLRLILIKGKNMKTIRKEIYYFKSIKEAEKIKDKLTGKEINFFGVGYFNLHFFYSPLIK